MNLKGKWQLCVCASGHLSMRQKGTLNPDYPSALPVWSANSASEVEDMITLTGRLQDDGTYVCSLPEFTFNDPSSLFSVGDRVEQLAAL